MRLTNTACINRICRLKLIATTSTPTRLKERVAELLRRAVVNDGVDTRVEIRQTIPQHAHRLHTVHTGNGLLLQQLQKL